MSDSISIETKLEEIHTSEEKCEVKMEEFNCELNEDDEESNSTPYGLIKEEEIDGKETGDSEELDPLLILKVEGGFSCPICSKRFASIEYLDKHMKRHPKNKGKHKCQYCPYATASKSHMAAHRRGHEGETPFVCDICSKGFISRSTLNLHSVVHSDEKKYVCDVCGKKFNLKFNLTAHKRLHSAEKPFVCDVCGKGFTHSHGLSLHRRLHTGEKPFACQYCTAAFRSDATLKKHEIGRHTRDFKHNCLKCGKGFLSPSELKKHPCKPKT